MVTDDDYDCANGNDNGGNDEGDDDNENDDGDERVRCFHFYFWISFPPLSCSDL